MNSIKSVWIEYTSKFDTKNLKKADKQISKTTDSLKTMGKVLVGIFAVAKVKQWAVGTLEVEKNYARVARQIGVSVKEVRKLNFLAQATGTSMSVVEDAAFEIKKRFGEIKVNKEFAKLMRRLGSPEKAAKGQNAVDLMFTTMDAIAKGPAEDIEKSLDLAFGGGAAKGLAGLVKDPELLKLVRQRAQTIKEGGGEAAIVEFQVTSALLQETFPALSSVLLV